MGYCQGDIRKGGASCQMVTPPPSSLIGVSEIVDRIDEGQAHLIQAFETGTGRDKNRCTIARDLGIKSVGSL